MPEGFRRIETATGISLYRKNYMGGTPDYVLVLDLRQGARLKLLMGDVQELRSERGAFGGNDARIQQLSLRTFWEHAAEEFTNLTCIVSGTFFYMQESPTRLPFPLKVDGNYITDGYAREQFTGKKLLLEIWDDHALITAWGREAFYQSNAPEILGGLAEDANKSATHYVGRTFLGILDDNQDGRAETILILSTRTARQVDAASVLRNFGAEQVMMLDGGGSTQLMCFGEPIIESDRYLPQALAVIAGKKNDNPEYLERVDQDMPVTSMVESEATREIVDSPVPEIALQDNGLRDSKIYLEDVGWVAATVLFAGFLVVYILSHSLQGYP